MFHLSVITYLGSDDIISTPKVNNKLAKTRTKQFGKQKAGDGKEKSFKAATVVSTFTGMYSNLFLC